jgi:hypothetical protein
LGGGGGGGERRRPSIVSSDVFCDVSVAQGHTCDC